MLNAKQQEEFEKFVGERLSKLNKDYGVVHDEKVSERAMDKEQWAQMLKEMDEELGASEVGVKGMKDGLEKPEEITEPKQKKDWLDIMNDMLKAGLPTEQYVGWLIGNSMQCEYRNFTDGGTDNPFKEFYKKFKKDNTDQRWGN